MKLILVSRKMGDGGGDLSGLTNYDDLNFLPILFHIFPVTDARHDI
jgi:hypothetical protein